VTFLFHPQTVHFPIALFLTATLFDFVYLFNRRDVFLLMSFYLIGLGLAGAAVSIVLGYVDLTKQVALGVGTGVLIQHRLHSLLAYAATAVYVLTFIGRWRRGMRGWLYPFSLAGAVLIAITGYVGGELRRVM
jgi:uncharacterized membrane protein